MSNLTVKEKQIIFNLISDKIDLCQRHIKKFDKDLKYYLYDRANWIPGEKLGDANSKYAKEIARQIDLESKKIDEYNEIIQKVMYDN